MRTPSLRGRVTIAGIAVIAVLIVALDAFVYLSLRDTLQEGLHELLAARMQLAQELAQTLDVERLDERLTALGVPATIRLADGTRVRSDPESTRFQSGPPGRPETLPAPLASRRQDLPNGGSITVFASRAGVQSTLDSVLVLELVGSIVAVALSVAVLWRISSVVLRPVDRIVRIARSIAAGREGGRLRPDRTDTDLGRMAAAFDEMLDELEAAVAEARSSERRTRRFLADAAHQLRTPLAGIRASVDTLLREPEPSERDRLLDNLAQESARVSRLIDSLLRLARLDEDPGVVTEPVVVRDLVGEEVERARELAPSLTIDLGAADLGDRTAEVEPASIREALANLLDNARRHADRRIRVDLAGTSDGVEVRVADDGPGLPDDRSEEAFDRFVSLDGQGGSGLGLPIARAVARNHGGDLTWRGDRFVLSLPDAPPEGRTAGGEAGV